MNKNQIENAQERYKNSESNYSQQIDTVVRAWAKEENDKEKNAKGMVV